MNPKMMKLATDDFHRDLHYGDKEAVLKAELLKERAAFYCTVRRARSETDIIFDFDQLDLFA